MAEKKGRLRWLGFKRETSASSIKWELGGAVWLHDKRQEGGARRIIAAVHLLFWTAAVGYDLDKGQEKPQDLLCAASGYCVTMTVPVSSMRCPFCDATVALIRTYAPDRLSAQIAPHKRS